MRRQHVLNIILTAALLPAGLWAGTLDDIRALEATKTDRRSPPASQGKRSSVPDDAVAGIPYVLSDGRQANLQDWTLVVFIQSSCPYCRQFAPVLTSFSRQTGISVFSFSLDGRGVAGFPDVLPATPDVMVEFFQGGVPVATPTTFLTNVNTMETWPLLQGAADDSTFRRRFSAVLGLALDRLTDSHRTSYLQEP